MVRACRSGPCRLRQAQLDLAGRHDVPRLALLGGSSRTSTSARKSSARLPLERVGRIVAIGGERPLSWQVGLLDTRRMALAEDARDRFLAFCGMERARRGAWSDRFRLPAVEAETLVRPLLVYRTLVARRRRGRIVRVRRDVAGGDISRPRPIRRPAGGVELSRQVLASAEALGQRYRFDAPHAHHVAKLANRPVRQSEGGARAGGRERLLLQVAHAAARRRRLRRPARASSRPVRLAASRFFGCPTRTAVVWTSPAPSTRLPQRLAHALRHASDREDRSIVREAGVEFCGSPTARRRHARKISATCRRPAPRARRSSSCRVRATSRWSRWRRARVPTCSPGRRPYR